MNRSEIDNEFFFEGKVYIYRKEKNDIIEIWPDGYDKRRNAFYEFNGVPGNYETTYTYIGENDLFDTELEDLLEEIGSLMSEEDKEYYKDELL